MPFNIGDRVRIISHECENQRGGSSGAMHVHVGNVVTISRIIGITPSIMHAGYEVEENRWLWDERLLELVEESVPVTNYKHLKVINKIKQMETRRKQMGYKSYQFVTGQKEDSGV